MRLGSLFSGYGGLDDAVLAVLGGTVAWHAEIDSAACRVLEHRRPGVPNLGDVTAVDWASAGPVDVVAAGYPCQPFSAAGRRLGEQDDRYMWPEVARAVRDLGPRLVVLENVSGHLVRGFPGVLGSLAELGYDARWTCLRASDVGAPHRRERLFAVAWPAADTSSEQVGTAGLARPRPRRATADATGDGRHERRAEPARLERGSHAAVGGAATTDAGGARLGQHTGAALGEEAGPRSRDEPADRGGARPAGDGRAAIADADGDGLAQLGRLAPIGRDADGRDGARQATAWGPYAPAVRRWEHALGRPAPAPTGPGRAGRPRLSPRFVEWMQGLPAGHVTDVPGVSRNDALRLLGNGVVPQQAAAALRWLLSEQWEVAA